MRTTFYEEQARNRRRTFRFTAVSIVAVLLAGIPVSVIVTPILFLVVMISAHLVNLVQPVPPAFWSFLSQVGRTVPVVADQVQKVADTNSLAGVDWALMRRITLAMIVPGMAAMFVSWLWVKALFARAGTGGVLLTLGARAPRPEDLEERQLQNLVEEMSIAAGIPPPKVMLLDRSASNVATVGSSESDATLVVSRGLLARLDRDQTQAVIGHAIASIVNGDLVVLTRLLAAFQTFGMLNTILSAPTEPGARRSLWRAVRSTFRRRDRTEIEHVAAMLASGEPDEDKQSRRAANNEGGFLALIVAPFILGAATARYLSTLGALIVYGPPLAALWRARRYLADASAVQLTRNPTALATALPLLDWSDKKMMAGLTSFLFVAGSGSGSVSVWGGFHPSIAKRRFRLESEGAVLVHGPAGPKRGLAVRLIVLPLMALAWALFGVGMVAAAAGALLMMGLSLVFAGVAMMVVHAAFVYGPGFIHSVVERGPGLIRAIGQVLSRLLAR